MSQPHSTPSAPFGKPNKPCLTFHTHTPATGRSCKKIKGRVHYFGRWDDPDGALREYHDFLAGKTVSKANRSHAAQSGKPANQS